jgi:chemotaxis protein CheZ
MANLPVPAPISAADYEAIEAAVMETARGRWFLAEYARRNRNADTTMLLKALDRIEASIRGEHSVEPVDRIRFDLVEMSKAIARTKTEIAAMKPDADHHGKFGEATEELDSVVQATEAATSDILECAERIQEIAWTLREQGLDADACDLLDAKATEVYTACSFQDLTGQRTRKVIGVLRYLEGRINAMIEIWGLDGAMAAEAAERRAMDAGKALLNGPALPGQGLDQADVDLVMGPAPVSRPEETASPIEPIEEAVVEFSAEDSAPNSPAAGPIAISGDDFEEIEEVEAQPAEAPQPRPRPSVAGDPLAHFMALSVEEKIAVFT